MTTGTVITFYSYKGGVGRSFTLANVAVLLARWGYRVLAVDWDLEAPGLHHYFKPVMPDQPEGGVIDLAHDFLAGAENPSPHAVRLNVKGNTLALLAAGRDDDSYTDRMQRIDWEDLYQRGFVGFLERCREEWTEEYDFVLIDSRTGVSDIAGICTAQLPDRLAVLFTANEQNLKDVVNVVRRADAARDRMPYDRPRHLVLPILSRLDESVEYKRAERWRRKCAEVVGPLFRNWLVKSVPEDLMLRHLTLPYIPFWSFGEQLSVLQEDVPSAGQVSFALETVAAVLAQQFDRTDLLADNRDAYVASARDRRQDFDLDLLVSSPRSTLRLADRLVEELRVLGLRVERSSSGDLEILDRTSELAEHLCLVVDGGLSRWQVTEVERFLRHTIGPDGGQRRLFCVLTDGTDPESLPGFLRHLQVGPGVTRDLYDMITGTPAGDLDPDLALTPPLPLDRPDLDVRVLYGGTVVAGSAPTLALPAPVAGGGSHDFAIRFRPPAASGAYLLYVPQHPVDLLDLRVRFGGAPTPPRVSVLDGAHRHDGVAEPGRGHPVDRAGEIHLRFRHLTPGLAYGVRWEAPGD